MQNKETSLLYNARDEAQAGLFAGILENAGIPYIMRHAFAGTLFGGAGTFGVELYVPTQSLEQARELLEAYTSQSLVELDDLEEY